MLVICSEFESAVTKPLTSIWLLTPPYDEQLLGTDILCLKRTTSKKSSWGNTISERNWLNCQNLIYHLLKTLLQWKLKVSNIKLSAVATLQPFQCLSSAFWSSNSSFSDLPSRYPWQQ